MWSRLVIAGLIAAVSVPPLRGGDPLEVSTGFLIGPRFDSHLFYVKVAKSAAWQKSYADSAYRKQAQGRLLGVTLNGFDDDLVQLKASGFNYARLELQNRERSLFGTDGRLEAGEMARFSRLLKNTAEAGIALELVLFHPERDHAFDTPEAMLEAARRLTDWLIEGNYRHVLLNPASQWQAPGWDFDHFVPQNLERIADVIRERFVAQRADFALPIALSAPMSSSISPRLAEQADVLVAFGEGAPIDPKRVERPILIEHSNPRDCAAMFEKFAGCLVVEPVRTAELTPWAPLVLKQTK